MFIKKLLIVIGLSFVISSLSYASEVLNPNKGKISNKVYTSKNAPNIKIGTYNIAARKSF